MHVQPVRLRGTCGSLAGVRACDLGLAAETYTRRA